LNKQIVALSEERDSAVTEAEDLGIKLANTKYELNRLQREHIKLQLEQEKYLEKFESFGESLKKGEEETLDLNEKSEIVIGEKKMDKKEHEVYNCEYY
jgi:chromosome segregation ATPase